MNFPHKLYDHSELGNHIPETFLPELFRYFLSPQEQFVFVHEAILESIMCGMNEVDSARIQKEIESLAQIQTSGMTGFHEKFKVSDSLQSCLYF